MSRPDKCKWCGEPEKNESLSATRYLCNTQYFRLIGTWVRGGQCEREELRKRVAAAVAAIEVITRYKMEADDQSDILFQQDDRGRWVEHEDVDEVLDILHGNSPEIPEGSP